MNVKKSMYQKSLYKKGIVLGIVMLFIGTSFVPGIVGDNEGFHIESTNENDYFTQPPEEEWNQTFGGWNNDVGGSVQQTTDGGYIIAGYTQSYGSHGSGDSNVWLIKTDSNGIEQWNKTFGSRYYDDGGSSVQQTNDGGYIITGYGYFWNAQVWLIKTDSNGNKQWDKNFGDNLGDYAYSVKQTNDGGYIISGNTQWYNSEDINDVWLIKTDSNGDMIWDKTFGDFGKHEYGCEVQQTNDGGYIVVGSQSGSDEGEENIILIKTDSSGNKQWNKTYRNGVGYSVQQTSDGGYIITGQYRDSGVGCYALWLIKTNVNGNIVWDKKFGDGVSGDEGHQIKNLAKRYYVDRSMIYYRCKALYKSRKIPVELKNKVIKALKEGTYEGLKQQRCMGLILAQWLISLVTLRGIQNRGIILSGKMVSNSWTGS